MGLTKPSYKITKPSCSCGTFRRKKKEIEEKSKQIEALPVMGKLVCSEVSEVEGVDLTGLLMALVIALVLMVICNPPPRRTYVMHRLA